MLDYFKFDLNSEQIKKRFHGTGIIISTAMGSSAYRLNN
jgi:NAD kinase